MHKQTRLTILSKSAAEVRGRFHFTGKGTEIMEGSALHSFSCGRCGAVLLKGIDESPIEAAAKCNSCSTYNDLSRPSRFLMAPPSLENLQSMPSPQLAVWIDEHWKVSPNTARIESLSTGLWRRWSSVQGTVPTLLHHYTSAVGLRGILSSHQLWAGDVAYMNDAAELQYGMSIVKELVEKAIAAASEMEVELLKRSTVDQSPLITRGDFVACFCSERDLLGQWRSYGSSGMGFALGFSSHALASHNQPCLRRVIYERQIQVSLIEDAIAACLQLFREVSKGKSMEELDKDRTLPAIASFLASRLTEFVFCFKHPGFQEEREWRLIFRGFRNREYMPLLQFRNDSLSTPYIPIGIRFAVAEPKNLPILPLVEVTHGPTQHPALAKKSLLLLLEKHGYDHVEIGESMTPFRVMT